MSRLIAMALCALLTSVSTADAQSWAEALFSARSHDFGSVARAANVEHTFVITNTTGQELHIRGVRSSCGCTAPRVEKNVLAPGERGAIVAAFNTHRFTGQRGARLTVTFERPAYAEVQLEVRGYIRTDVVLNPGQATFGTVSQGREAEARLALEYAGRNDWQITKIVPASSYVTAEAVETGRANGRVSYQLNVKLRPDAPAGYVRDELIVYTNDRRATQFPIAVDGLVVSELTVSPATLLLGNLQPGQHVTKQIIVRGKTPFRITGVECEDQTVSLNLSGESKTMHILPLEFTANEQPQSISTRLRIHTDLESAPVTELPIVGHVIAPFAGK